MTYEEFKETILYYDPTLRTLDEAELIEMYEAEMLAEYDI